MKSNQERGFSFIEGMIAMVVLSVAFLGLATLVMRTQGLKSRNTRLQESNYLTKKKLSALSTITYVELGTGDDPASNILYGAPDGAVVTYGPLNKIGLTAQESSQGPFLYMQSFVVCIDDTEGGHSIPAALNSPSPCGDLTQYRTNELSCDVARTGEGQIELRVLTTYRDKDGQCHASNLSNIVVDLET